MRTIVTTIILTFIAGGVVSIAEVPTGFINKTLEVRDRKVPCSVYVPRDYDPDKKWPLIVFLHGMGERGDDGLIQSEVGIGRAIRRNPERFPCIVAMPQCPKDSTWNERFDVIDVTLQKSLDEYAIDESRVYLTGLSMGGYGTWLYGAQHSEKFAALLPICGGGKVADAPALAKVPIWAFHGGADTVVKPSFSTSMVDAIKAAGGNVQYTEYPEVGHNSWDQTYGDEKVIAWLLDQKK